MSKTSFSSFQYFAFLVQVLVRSAIYQYSFYIVLVFFKYLSSSFSFSKQIAIVLVIVLFQLLK